jgi:hypothetical protein
MRRGSIFVIIFALIALVVVGASQFLRAQPPQEITVAVSPLAEVWARAAAERFNATRPLVNGTQPIVIRIQAIDDPLVWQDSTRTWNAQTHPDAWIPALTESVAYAVEARLPFELLTPSVAQTPLVWGIFASRAAAANPTDNPLDWAQAQTTAAAESWSALAGGQANWGFVKFLFGAPDRTSSGLGVLLSGAAAFYDNPQLVADTLTAMEFRNWLLPVLASVPNFNTVGADPAATLTRGPSAGEIALLPESQWLVNLSGIVGREAVQLSYPRYAVVYRFPVAVWNDAETTPTVRAAAQLFADHLLTPEAQSAALSFGLRPVMTAVSEDAALFTAGVPYGTQLSVDFTQSIQLPPREAILRLLAWVNTAR